MNWRPSFDLRVWAVMALVFVAGCGETGGEDGAGARDVALALRDESTVAQKTAAVEVAEPSDCDPVKVGAAAFPARVRMGDVATVVVRARIAGGWYIYGIDGPSGAARPTELRLTLPEGIETHGVWLEPEAVVETSSLGPVSVYRDEAVFRREIVVGEAAAPGEAEVLCEFHYQACDPARCLMPAKIELRFSLTILPEKE